jgi:hypothetical protein
MKRAARLLKRVDLGPIDEFLDSSRRFSSAQWGYLYHRLLADRSVARDLVGLVEFTYGARVRSRIPKRLQAHLETFWRAVDTVLAKERPRAKRPPRL